jgi:hypothetical protein
MGNLMKTISLTIPLDYIVLSRISEMLSEMADELKPSDMFTSEEIQEADELINIPPPPPLIESKLSEPNPSVFNVEQTTAMTVELDADDLPWDERIHAGSKAKLAKTQQWRKKRGVSSDLILQVETELKAVMNVPAPEPVIPAPAPEPVIPAPAPEPVIPAPAPEPTIMTFPEFLVKITTAMNGGGLENSRVLEILNKHDIPSLPLLSARPDLIPSISKELFNE